MVVAVLLSSVVGLEKVIRAPVLDLIPSVEREGLQKDRFQKRLYQSEYDKCVNRRVIE